MKYKMGFFLSSVQSVMILYMLLTLGAHAQRGLQTYSSCLVCVYVCLSAHVILAIRAIRSITKDAIVLTVRFAAILNIKMAFFLKLSYSKVRASCTYLGSYSWIPIATSM